jgi:hypothetical protein
MPGTDSRYQKTNPTNSVGRATNNEQNTIGTSQSVGRATNTVALAPVSPTVLDNGAAGTVATSRLPDTSFSNQSQAPIIAKLGGTPVPSLRIPANSSFDARLSSLGLNFSPETNPLNALANYTYHIRFFLTNELTAFNNIDPANPNSNNMVKYVVAESGVTAGFNITDLAMEAITAPDNRKRNMFHATEFTMTIVEPLNLSLLDKIYTAAQSLGIKNHLKCPFFLEIWFNGYDENGVIISPHQYYNIYRVMVTDVQAATTASGSTYTLKLIVYDAIGEMNQISTPQSSLKIKAVTLSDFFMGLESAMNNMAGNVNNDGVRRNTYKFVYPDQWKTWNIKPSDVDKQVARQTDMKASLLGNQTVITIAKGQGIENIINFAVYLSQDVQKWITGEDSATTGGATLSDHAIIRYVAVYSDVIINEPYWDPVLQDYIRQITYTLVPTETVKAFTDLATANTASKPQTQLAKLQYLIDKHRLVKRYDYIYTGLNTEILQLDIKIDNYWAINIPIWNQNNSYYQHAQGPLAAQESQGWLQQKGLLPQDKPPPIAARILQIDQSLNGTAQGNASYANGQAVNDYSNRNVRYTESLLEEKANLQNQLAYNTRGPGAAGNGPSTTSAASTTGGNTINNNLSSGSMAAARAAEIASANKTVSVPNAQTARQAALSSVFIEDLATANLSRPLPLPLSGIQDPKPTNINAQQNADQSKVSADRDPQAYANGTGFVGAIFGNLFDKTAFMNVDMTIRGDPWWIPLGNLQQTLLAKRLVGNQAVDNNSVKAGNAAYIGGDNCVLLQYRIGVVIDEATGLAKSGADGADFVNGIYVITNVTNTFSHGKFTQQIKGFKDILSQSPAAKLSPGGPGAGRVGLNTVPVIPPAVDNAPSDPIANFQQSSGYVAGA